MGKHFNLVLRFNKSKKNQIRRLNTIMSRLDWDWDEGAVYRDGVNMWWRKPFVNQEQLVEVLVRLKLHGTGYFLPSGQNCPEGTHWQDWCADEHHKLPGYRYCDAVPQSTDWFTF